MTNIAAIELGSEKIACAVASVDTDADKKIRIIGFATIKSRGIKRAQVIDIQEVTKSLEVCLTQTERMAGTRINKAVLVVSGPNISSQTSHGVVAVNYQNQDIGHEDVDRAIESAKAVSLPANREIIHVLPTEFIVDGQSGIKNPIGMSGVRLEVNTHIITASKTNLNNIQKICSLLGVEVETYVFAGLAASYACVNDTEKELGCVVVDIGGGTSDLCIFSDSAVVHSAVIPLGSKNVTSDIAAGLRVSLASAETIKTYCAAQYRKTSIHKGAEGKSEDNILLSSLHLPERLEKIPYKTLVHEIMEPRLKEIADFIAKELRGFSLKDQTPSGVIITGGGAQTPFLKAILEEEIGLPVRIGQASGLAGIADELLEPAYSALTGALRYALDQNTPQKTSHLPDISSIFKKFEFKESAAKVVDFLKSFIPGVK